MTNPHANTESTILTTLPGFENGMYEHVLSNFSNVSGNAYKVAHILEDNVHTDEYEVKDSKYLSAMDIVDEESTKTCCFTKGYGRFAKGTGSVLQQLTENKEILRYFTPTEISRLMCFPKELKFPSNVKRTDLYKALGNSVNVFVISLLVKFMYIQNCE